MKKYIVLVFVALISFSCNGQENKLKNNENEKEVEKPKGAWKVDKEFDENGNLIRYDSIYSWSSNNKFNNFSSVDSDSLMQTFKSRFYSNFSMFENQGFGDVFSQDSLFNNRFFNDSFFESSFGKDFMDIEQMRKRMEERQKKFLEKYQSEFNNQKKIN